MMEKDGSHQNAAKPIFPASKRLTLFQPHVVIIIFLFLSFALAPSATTQRGNHSRQQPGITELDIISEIIGGIVSERC